MCRGNRYRSHQTRLHLGLLTCWLNICWTYLAKFWTSTPNPNPWNPKTYTVSCYLFTRASPSRLAVPHLGNKVTSHSTRTRHVCRSFNNIRKSSLISHRCHCSLFHLRRTRCLNVGAPYWCKVMPIVTLGSLLPAESMHGGLVRISSHHSTIDCLDHAQELVPSGRNWKVVKGQDIFTVVHLWGLEHTGWAYCGDWWQELFSGCDDGFPIGFHCG